MSSVYHCNEPTCSLGARGQTGRFTGGITPQGRNILLGRPVEECTAENEGAVWGEGVCPNCGEQGAPADDEYTEHVSVVGFDPNQDLHDEVAALVADESREDVTSATAQALLESKVAERESAEEES